MLGTYEFSHYPPLKNGVHTIAKVQASWDNDRGSRRWPLMHSGGCGLAPMCHLRCRIPSGGRGTGVGVNVGESL